MKKVFMFLCCLSLALPVPAQAQTARPYTTRVVTLSEILKACRDEDRSVLIVSCEQYRADVTFAVQKMGFKGDDGNPLSFKDKEEFLNYLSHLSTEKVPQHEVVSGRVLTNGAGELGAFSRMPREGEQCGYDRLNIACAISLSCGNPFGTAVQIARSRIGDTAEDELLRKKAAEDAENARRQQQFQGRGSSGWDWLNPTKVKGVAVWLLTAGGVACAMLCRVENVAIARAEATIK